MAVDEEDLFEVEDKASYIYTPDDPEYTEEEPDFEFTEEQAAEILEEFVVDSLQRLEGNKPILTSPYKRLEEALRNAERIKKARKKDKEAYPILYRQIQKASQALTDFLRAFFRAYLKYRPTPLYKNKFPHSVGRYQNSSIIYFTNDATSRDMAIIEATSNKFDYEHPFFGQRYLLRYLRPSEIMRPDGDIQKRIAVIKGGISIENIAFNKELGSDMHYYGWENVEMYGWKRKDGTIKPPYKPFQHALKEAEMECPNVISYNVIP